MPLTAKGEKILDSMTETYGDEDKAKSVLYASINAGKITGAEEGGKRKRRKKRLAKSGLRQVLYLFFKAEQGSLFAMPTGVKGYVTKRGKVVSAYTAKRKKAGEDQSGDLFSQAANPVVKPEPVAEKPEPGMEPFTGDWRGRQVTFQPMRPFYAHPGYRVLAVEIVKAPRFSKYDADRFARKIPAAPYFRAAALVDKDTGNVYTSFEYPTDAVEYDANHVALNFDHCDSATIVDVPALLNVMGPVAKRMVEQAKMNLGQKPSERGPGQSEMF